jgi:4-hydroxy-4-methyl-2-oxoglutarate aldolase
MQIIKPGVEHDDLVRRLRRLSVALVGDALDRLGFRQQVLSHVIRPVVPGPSVAGPAFTVLAEPSEVLPEHPYEHEIAAVDAITPGSLVVLATRATCGAAVWGELLATVAAQRGAVGTVSDGAVRDVAGLRRLGLPTYAAAVCARDSAGRLLVTGFGGEVVCGGVRLSTGDLVLADEDGVVALPPAAAAEAIAAAEAKLSLEDVARRSLSEGTSLAAAYERHGVL